MLNHIPISILFSFSVKPNVSYTGLAARNWMIHMNPIANKSIESNQSSGKDKNSSRKTSSTPTVAANALAALALGGVSRRSRKNRSTKRRASSSSYPSKRPSIFYVNRKVGGWVRGRVSIVPGLFQFSSPGTFPIFKSRDFWTSLVPGPRDLGTFKVSRSCPV